MNIQLGEVLTDVLGTTGMAILRTIAAGERDPQVLAQHRTVSCRASVAVIAKALTGTWKDEQIFVLQQALILYGAYTAHIRACDGQSEAMLTALESRAAPDTPLPELPSAKPNSNSKNAPCFNARAHYARLLGVDLVAVTGLSATTVQTIISEIGTDMRRFPTVKQFCSWLGLVPRNAISGGKVLRSRVGKVVSRANQAFRMAAQAVSRTDTLLGAYYRSMRARKGPQQAIVGSIEPVAAQEHPPLSRAARKRLILSEQRPLLCGRPAGPRACRLHFRVNTRWNRRLCPGWSCGHHQHLSPPIAPEMEEAICPTTA